MTKEPTDEFDLLAAVRVLLVHKKLIMRSCAGAAVLSAAITLLLPNVYSATARILPTQDSATSLSALQGGFADIASLTGMSLGNSPGDIYVGMIKSRTVADAMIDKFNLMDVYDQKYRVKARTSLEEHCDISVGKKDGIVSITVEDEDPQRAAQMANALVDLLKDLSVRINLTGAGIERVFLEERLRMVKDELVDTEEKLRDFQSKTKAIKIDAQAAAIIDSISKLKSDIAAREVELKVLLATQTEQSPHVKAVREAIEELRAQLLRLEANHAGLNPNSDIFVGADKIPELGMQLTRLYRDFKAQEAVYELLTKQYELAKINEAKNTSMIQVLDEAVPPDKKIRPKRTLLVLAATFLAGVLSCLAAFVIAHVQATSLPDRERIESGDVP